MGWNEISDVDIELCEVTEAGMECCKVSGIDKGCFDAETGLCKDPVEDIGYSEISDTGQGWTEAPNDDIGWCDVASIDIGWKKVPLIDIVWCDVADTDMGWWRGRLGLESGIIKALGLEFEGDDTISEILKRKIKTNVTFLSIF